MLKNCSNAYVLSNLEYCDPALMSSTESHLCTLDSIVLSAERFSEDELRCLGHRRKVGALYLLFKIYNRVDHLMNEHLINIVAACNTKASATLGELALVISRCRTDQFSLSFKPAAVRL